MPIEQRTVPITGPCPLPLDIPREAGDAKRWFCGHCEKHVHVLSNMSEREVRELLSRHVGEQVCVSYDLRKDGTLKLRPEPSFVPTQALRRARTGWRATAAATLALAVCDPLGVSAPPEDAGDISSPEPPTHGMPLPHSGVLLIDEPHRAPEPPQLPSTPQDEAAPSLEPLPMVGVLAPGALPDAAPVGPELDHAFAGEIAVVDEAMR